MIPYGTTHTDIETLLRRGVDEPALRRALGDVFYDELVDLARQLDAEQGAAEVPRQKVFILPGIMGSRLSVVEDGHPFHVWIDPVEIAAGSLSRLKWGATVVASGTVFAPYIRMKLRLRLAGFDVEFLPYDWRQSPAASAAGLMRMLRKRGVTGAALVCHSMGGLVARAMAAKDPGAETISRVITAGTPNRGAYAPLQIYDLSHGMLSKLALVDLTHSREDLVGEILGGLPGLAEMLPSPAMRPEEAVFTSAFWPQGTVPPPARALARAEAAAAALPLPDHRFHQVIGLGYRTIVSARPAERGFSYSMSRDGDGTVPRDLAELDGATSPTPRYYVEAAHGWILNAHSVIRATIELLRNGTTDALPPAPVEALTEPTETVTTESLRGDLPTAAPVSEVDYTGGLLAQESDAPNLWSQTKMPFKQAMQSYSAEIVRLASAHWEASVVERDVVIQSRSQAQPLQAESHERLDAYTRRLISVVDAASIAPEARKITRQLEGALRSMTPVSGAAPTPPAALERIIGEAEEFLSVMFIKRAIVASRAVGRIVLRETGRGFGTGFLIAPGVLITNHHVLETAEMARGAQVQFRYELEIDSREAPSHTFELNPERLFYANERLDIAIIAVAPRASDGTAIESFGFLPLIGVEGKIRKGQPVNIIQHPLAGRKQVVFRDSILSALPTTPDHVAHYTGDTQPGASGAPVFSDLWEVVAIHHSGVPRKSVTGLYLNQSGTPWNPATDPEMRTVDWIANEGIRISRIVRHLEGVPRGLAAEGRAGAELVEEVLSLGHRAARDGTFPAQVVERPVLPPGRAVENVPQPEATLTLPVQISVGEARIVPPLPPGPMRPTFRWA